MKSVNDLQFSIIIASAAFLAGIVFYFVLSFIIRLQHRRILARDGQSKLNVLIGPLRLLVPALSIAFVLPIMRLSDEAQERFNHIIELWIYAATGWLLVKLVLIARDVILARYDIEQRDNLRARQIYTQLRIIGHIVNFVIVLLTVAFMILSFSEMREVGLSLLASAGIAGVIIGFAAQKTLGNLLAGIQIAITQPIRMDDVVIVENEWGWIEEITLTYVVVRIWDLRRLVVPISNFIEKPFQNWTRKSADLLGSVFVYADYTVPVDALRGELTRVLENSSYWDKKVNVLQVTNLTDKTVELRALMSAADSPTAWNLRCEVREKLLGFLQAKYPESLPRMRVLMDKKASTP
ncbi:MAG TPA: mechanosensitive ion channel family protein [bacterium]|nr:mechanosensitive ion channel family protein [bacterium]